MAFAIAAGAFGSAFQHGYNTGVVNAPQSLIMNWINRDCEKTIEGTTEIINDLGDANCLTKESVTLIWSWIVSSFCVGGIIGGSTVGIVASKLGRKGGLLLNNILMAISGLFMFFAKTAGSWEMLLIGKIE